MKAANNYRRHRAAYFDGLVITTSILLGFVFPSLGDFFHTPGFYYFFLAGISCYVLGAWLKHRPLSFRLQSVSAMKEVPFLLFHIIGHWFIFLGALVLASPALNGLIKMITGHDLVIASNGFLLCVALLSALITWMVYRPLKWKEGPRRATGARMDRQELAADFFLVAGASILSFFFWEKGVLSMMAQMKPSGFADLLFVFFFLALLFVLFYLPLRYFYYIEEEPGVQAKRLLLIFAVLLIRSVLP